MQTSFSANECSQVVPSLQTPPVVVSALFKLLHFVSLDLQDYTQFADSRCFVDSLLPHPAVSGRAMPFTYGLLYFPWVSCQGAICHQPPCCSKHRQALCEGFPSSHPHQDFLRWLLPFSRGSFVSVVRPALATCLWEMCDSVWPGQHSRNQARDLQR